MRIDKQWKVLLGTVIAAVIILGSYWIITIGLLPDKLQRPSEIYHSGGRRSGGSLSLFSTSPNTTCTKEYSTGKTEPMPKEDYQETTTYQSTTYYYIGHLSLSESRISCSSDEPLLTRYYNSGDHVVGLILCGIGIVGSFALLETAYVMYRRMA